MILRMPEYCREFRCSADKCGDNCCIGWEIDIDSETAEYYMNLEGGFGKRLRENIRVDDGYSFILQNERCPFLNDRNLCDIILNSGEDKLCYICDNHPRYYEWFGKIKEGGVGLCCEEAARLILQKGGTLNYWDRNVPDEECDDYDDALYGFLNKVRDKISVYLLDKAVSLGTAAYSVMLYAEKIQVLIDNGMTEEVPEIETIVCKETKADRRELFGFLEALEPIDENWKPYVRELMGVETIRELTSEQESYIRNIGVYFIWRYFMKGVFDEEIYSRVTLAVMSMVVVRIMFGAETETNLEHCSILAKNYSKEIEYSEENIMTICDAAYTEELLSAESLALYF